MSYMEPLLNSPGALLHVSCPDYLHALLPLHLHLFSSYKHSFRGQPRRSCFPSLLPSAHLLWGRLRGAQEPGVEPPSIKAGSPSLPLTQEAGIG